VLFHVTGEFFDNSEEAIQRNLAFFSQWTPPDGFEFKGFWGFADRPRSSPSRKPRQSLAKPRLHARPSPAR
jgi:hypothetical protein